MNGTNTASDSLSSGMTAFCEEELWQRDTLQTRPGPNIGRRKGGVRKPTPRPPTGASLGQQSEAWQLRQCWKLPGYQGQLLPCLIVTRI